MNVRFDSLNRFEAPELFICSPGSVMGSDGKLTYVIGSLVDYSDLEGVYNFNSLSELNFRAYKVDRDDPGERGYTYRLYRALQNRRLIFVDGIGFFVITNVTNGMSDGQVYKDVEASSCEVEIQSKALPYIEDNTYAFTPLLESLVSVLPLWTIGHVDSAVASKYRTFEDVDVEKNIYAFMLEDMQDAYECIFLFDIINRQINVYDQNSYVMRTDIHLTKDDLISGVEIRENADNLYTAISVTGENELGIQAVNPLGGNVIYNFDYYLDWMSDGLRSKVVQWKAAVSAAEDAYYEKNQEYYEDLQERSGKQAEYDRLNQQYELYQRMRSNIVAETGAYQVYVEGQDNPVYQFISSPSASEISSYNEAIEAVGGDPVTVDQDIADMLSQLDEYLSIASGSMSDVVDEIQTIDESIHTIEGEITAIHDAVSISNFFTTEEYDELYHYIFEGEYSDEYVMLTDSMTYEEQFVQMKTLYDRAVDQLTRISQPRQEFDIDVENFIFVKDFEPWSEELQTGALINVELLDNANVDHTAESGDTLESVSASYGMDADYIAEYNGLTSRNLSVGQVIRIPVNDIAALFLTAFTVNYEDQTLSMTFGNRFDKFDLRSLYEDVLGSVKKSNNTLQYVKEILYPIKNGELDVMKEAIRNSRTLTKNLVMSADHEQVVIDDTGYTGRSLNTDGSFDPHQVRITGKTMAFTDDAWETCKVALGEIVWLDDQNQQQTTYGLNAETLIGELIIGNNLQIYAQDESGKYTLFQVMDDRITSTVSSATQGLASQEDLAGAISGLSQTYTTIEQTDDKIRVAVGGVTDDYEAELNKFSTASESGDERWVTSVKTEKEFTFDRTGLNITSSTNAIKNTITEKGMFVKRVDSEGADTEDILTANTDGVDALNLHSRQFLIIGKNCRFEDYGTNKTACFYIGG